MKLIPALAAVALVAPALPALATPPLPLMLAQATLQPDGVAVAWTAPGGEGDVDQYVLLRSRAGAASTQVATLPAGTFHFTDAEGQPADLYQVAGHSGGQVTRVSNPAPVALQPSACPWLTDDTPPEVNCACFPCP